MSHFVSGLLGTVAGALALGAVHLEVANGNDLLGPAQRGDAGLSTAATKTRLAVNRDAKGDRNSTVELADGVTISYRAPGVENTTIMLRVPSQAAKTETTPGKRRPQEILTGSSVSRAKAVMAIACEPSVSLLTAVAKQLQPGRCIT